MPKFTSPLDDYIPSGEGSQATVCLRGAGFGEEQQVEVSSRSCRVTGVSHSRLVCQVPRLPAGLHPVTLLVTPHGFALSATTAPGIFLTVQPALAAVEPPSTAEMGRCECEPSKGAASCFVLVMASSGSSGLSLIRFSPDEEEILWPQSTFKNDPETDRIFLGLYAVSQVGSSENSIFKCTDIHFSKSSMFHTHPPTPT